MTKLTVAIMVKNEESTITKTLTSCIGFIDTVVLYDTGSTDNTIKLVKQFCDTNSVKLHLMEGEWETYAISRNRLLTFSETIVPKDEFYMILDANDELVSSYNFVDNLQQNIPLSVPIVVVNSRWKVAHTIAAHVKVLFIRSHHKCRYEGGIHEYLTVDGQPISNKLFIEGVELYQDRRFDEEKTLKRAIYDIKMLKQDLLTNKHVGRTLFLLGRTMFNIKKYDKCIKWLTESANHKGYTDIEERYMTQYYLAISKKFLGLDWMPHIFQAYDLIPTKIEIVLFLCLHLSLSSLWNSLYLFAIQAVNIAKTKSNYSDISHNETDYKIYCWYYHLLACLHLGKLTEGLESVAILDKNLEEYKKVMDLSIDLEFNDVVTKYGYLRDIYLPLQSVHNNDNHNHEQNIVLFGGLGYHKWNGLTINSEHGLGGAETVVSNLAEQLSVRIGHKCNIVVFSDTDKNCYVNGVYYLSLDYYDVFTLLNRIKTLFVFRYTDALRYHDNIDKTVLVLEDVGPIGTKIEYNTKLTNIVCKTEWHKNKFLELVPSLKTTGLPVTVIPNGIDPTRFSDNNKTPYKFIYSSCMTRGLNNLLRMWPKIRDILPSATLELFITYNCPYYQPHHKINEMIKTVEELSCHGVTRYDRVSQQVLAKHIVTADIWLYPTQFTETFCITALEMMMGRVLCITSKLAGLIQVVGDRGILIDYNGCEEQDYKFLDVIQDLADNKINKTGLTDLGHTFALTQSWNNVADQFMNLV
jgi:glycosyltransferase involved in cell wall biosynthesis